MTNAAFNLAQMERYPNWFEHIDKVEAAMAESERVYNIRWKAGWVSDEGGFYSPCGMHESDWDLEGYPFPEDPGYAEWADAFWHYEALDVRTSTP